MDPEFIGASGTLVSAALESVGCYYQSVILDALREPFTTSAGGLLYLIGILTGLITFVISGRFNYSLTLLITPGLFFAVVLYRTPTEGAAWLPGLEERDPERLHSEVSMLLYEASGGSMTVDTYDAEVSSVFARYDLLVSRVVQEFVRVLNTERLDADIGFMVRSQIFSSIDYPMVFDPGFRELLHAGLMYQCQDLVEASQNMLDHRISSCDRCHWARIYQSVNTKPVGLPPNARRYLAELHMDFPDLFESESYAQSTCAMQSVLDSCQGGCAEGQAFDDAQVETCNALSDASSGLTDIWCANQANQSGLLANLRQMNTREAAELGEQFRADYIASKQALDQRVFTCQDLWRFVYVGLHRHALETFSAAVNSEQKELLAHEQLDICSFGSMQDMFNSPNARYFELFSAWTGFDDPNMVVNQIARNLWRRETEKGSINSIAATYYRVGGEIDELGIPNVSNMSLTGRSRTSEKSWQERSRLMVTANTLPYYQGLGYYFLSVTFPFFALLLLVPGKHSGFFLWFALWAWVKSWDIGFAVVMLLDDALYSLFVSNLMDIVNNLNHGLSSDLAVALYSLHEEQEPFELGTYYNILSIALMSVPTVTGYIFLGSLKGGVGIIAQGSEMVQMQRYIDGSLSSQPTGITNTGSANHTPYGYQSYIPLSRGSGGGQRSSQQIPSQSTTRPGLPEK